MIPFSMRATRVSRMSTLMTSRFFAMGGPPGAGGRKGYHRGPPPPTPSLGWFLPIPAGCARLVPASRRKGALREPGTAGTASKIRRFVVNPLESLKSGAAPALCLAPRRPRSPGGRHGLLAENRCSFRLRRRWPQGRGPGRRRGRGGPGDRGRGGRRPGSDPPLVRPGLRGGPSPEHGARAGLLRAGVRGAGPEARPGGRGPRGLRQGGGGGAPPLCGARAAAGHRRHPLLSPGDPGARPALGSAPGPGGGRGHRLRRPRHLGRARGRPLLRPVRAGGPRPGPARRLARRGGGHRDPHPPRLRRAPAPRPAGPRRAPLGAGHQRRLRRGAHGRDHPIVRRDPRGAPHHRVRRQPRPCRRGEARRGAGARPGRGRGLRARHAPPDGVGPRHRGQARRPHRERVAGGGAPDGARRRLPRPGDEEPAVALRSGRRGRRRGRRRGPGRRRSPRPRRPRRRSPPEAQLLAAPRAADRVVDVALRLSDRRVSAGRSWRGRPDVGVTSGAGCRSCTGSSPGRRTGGWPCRP